MTLTAFLAVNIQKTKFDIRSTRPQKSNVEELADPLANPIGEKSKYRADMHDNKVNAVGFANLHGVISTFALFLRIYG